MFKKVHSSLLCLMWCYKFTVAVCIFRKFCIEDKYYPRKSKYITYKMDSRDCFQNHRNMDELQLSEYI